MTATNPRTRILSRRACIAGLAGFLALTGCKSRDSGGEVGAGGAPTKIRDPLVYGPTRIPPQNVPLPERGGIGAKGRADPLTTPAGKNGDKTGVGYSDSPDRFKGAYNPGPGTAPAALAGKNLDAEELKIDTPDNRVPLRQASGVLPAGSVEAPSPPGLEPLFSELAKYGVTRADRTLVQENGDYTFRASVPISGNGAKRQYTAVGKTGNEAVKQVLDQVIADRK
ncbi:MAG: hypothetical protein C0467_02160 [Planctomycetaceae bacterium]|nr:hypothetical protein [Planctomycetaceae bacterium]